HANALWYTVYAALWAGASVALYERFSARNFWSEIRESGATVFNCLGAMANIIWQLRRAEDDTNHNVRSCMLVPVSADLADGFQDRYGITVTSVYAMTENFAVTVFGPNDDRHKISSMGRVRDYADVRIADENGLALPPGEVGEILVRPNCPGMVMKEYYKMPEATVQSTSDLWFHTGDLGYLDADGYLFFSERSKEAIRRRGENISAYELETILCRHEAVYEAAAVPVPSELSEDDVLVYVVLEPGAQVSYRELIEFCIANMAYFM